MLPAVDVQVPVEGLKISALAVGLVLPVVSPPLASTVQSERRAKGKNSRPTVMPPVAWKVLVRNSPLPVPAYRFAGDCGSTSKDNTSVFGKPGTTWKLAPASVLFMTPLN